MVWPTVVDAALTCCIQNVSPVGARNSCSLVWPAPTVRATARSKSLPTPNTKDPIACVARLAVALVEVFAATADAPTPLALVNAITSSDWLTGAPSTVVTDCVLVTVALVSTAGAVAVQISETPRDVAARCTLVHARPAPDTVMFWVLAPVVGPSDPISAMSTSPAVVVLSVTDRAPVPSAETDVCTVGLPPVAPGPSETTSETAVPGATLAPPAGFWLMTDPATTVALFALVTAPFARPAPVIALCAAVRVWLRTFGTVTSAGPSETTSETALPGATLAPPAGFWLMTDPAAMTELFAFVTAPLVRPAPVIADCAVPCVWFTTFGTVIVVARVTFTVPTAVCPNASRI